MITATARLERTDDIVMTVTLTMTVKEWGEITKQLDAIVVGAAGQQSLRSYWPCGKAAELVREVIRKKTQDVIETPE